MLWHQPLSSKKHRVNTEIFRRSRRPEWNVERGYVCRDQISSRKDHKLRRIRGLTAITSNTVGGGAQSWSAPSLGRSPSNRCRSYRCYKDVAQTRGSARLRYVIVHTCPRGCSPVGGNLISPMNNAAFLSTIHVCVCVFECVYPHLSRAEMRKPGALAVPLPPLTPYFSYSPK